MVPESTPESIGGVSLVLDDQNAHGNPPLATLLIVVTKDSRAAGVANGAHRFRITIVYESCWRKGDPSHGTGRVAPLAGRKNTKLKRANETRKTGRHACRPRNRQPQDKAELCFTPTYAS